MLLLCCADESTRLEFGGVLVLGPSLVLLCMCVLSVCRGSELLNVGPLRGDFSFRPDPLRGPALCGSCVELSVMM